MEIARTRIYRNPEKYVHHIYGEHEAGGTGWLYISPVPFNEVGFRTDLGSEPYPEYTKEFLYTVPGVLLVVPPLLYGLSQLTKKDEENIPEKGEENHE
jgi:formate dehydrogenase iron-sulfur subunit